MLRAGYFHKGRYQGILVRIGLHKNIKQVVYHKKSEKQNDPLDEWRGSEEKLRLWQVLEWK